jgi:hypothetical protein
MTKLLASIDSDVLDQVIGGASRSQLVLSRLNHDFGAQGDVSFIGKPSFHSTSTPGVSRATGKFDVNALWGGDTQRSFSALVDRSHNRVSGLHTKVIGSE